MSELHPGSSFFTCQMGRQPPALRAMCRSQGSSPLRHLAGTLPRGDLIMTSTSRTRRWFAATGDGSGRGSLRGCMPGAPPYIPSPLHFEPGLPRRVARPWRRGQEVKCWSTGHLVIGSPGCSMHVGRCTFHRSAESSRAAPAFAACRRRSRRGCVELLSVKHAHVAAHASRASPSARDARSAGLRGGADGAQRRMFPRPTISSLRSRSARALQEGCPVRARCAREDSRYVTSNPLPGRPPVPSVQT